MEARDLEEIIEQQAQQIKQLKYDLETAERALQRKGYRKECDSPVCNCGPQWTHGGHAEQRLSEISDAVPHINGTTILGRVERLMQQIATLREALQLLYDVQNGCPLPKYQKDWDRAMELTQQALKEVKE